MHIMISFLIPCYRSEDTIEFVINEIEQKMSEREEYDYEIVAVNDASPDDVLTKLCYLMKKNNKIKIIDLAKNSGKEAALMAGYRNVLGDIVVNLDDDGQCPVYELWNLVDPLFNGYDVSIASYSSKKQSAFKNFGSRVNSIMTRVLLEKPKDIQLSNFMALKRFVVDEIVRYENPFPYALGIIFKSTSKIINVPMEERERFSGTGSFTFRKSLSLWLNGFTAFSVKPLRLSSLIGALCAVIGFLFGIITIIKKLIIPNISVGWSSIVSIMLFIGGLIMLMLGMIGEYIGRIYISINSTSQYVIRQKIFFEEKTDE